MISNKTSNRPMLLTTHNVQAAQMKSKIAAIPEDKRTEAQKRFIADIAFELKTGGMVTIHDVRDAKAEKVKADDAAKEAEFQKLLASQKKTDKEKTIVKKEVKADGKKKHK